jgi:hypothetical protein
MTRPQCVDCKHEGYDALALWRCTSPTCHRDLPALCDDHAGLHKRRSHVVTALVSDKGLPAEAVLGVTHCPRPEHVGTAGALTHFCATDGCETMVCTLCAIADHVTAGHAVRPLDAAMAAGLDDTLRTALPVLRAGTAHHWAAALAATAQRRELDEGLATVRAGVAAAYEAIVRQLATAKQRLLAAAVAAYDAKAEALTCIQVWAACMSHVLFVHACVCMRGRRGVQSTHTVAPHMCGHMNPRFPPTAHPAHPLH